MKDTRVSYKDVLQGSITRVSYKGPIKVPLKYLVKGKPQNKLKNE